MLAEIRESFDYGKIPAVEPAERHWYIVHTGPRWEWGVHRALRQLGYDTLYLHYQGIVRHARRAIAVIKPLYPRYLYVGAFEEQGLYDASQHPGVATLLYGGDGPYQVDHRVVENERRKGNEKGCIAGYERLQKGDKRVPQLRPGDKVRIVAGPLQGFDAIVKVDNGEKIHTLVATSRGALAAELKPDAITLPGGLRTDSIKFG